MVVLTANKNNFDEVCQDFFSYLPKAAYICIDEEMSGIWQPPMPKQKKKTNTATSKEDTPSERYKKEYQVIAERYSILQIGIVLFLETNTISSEEEEKENVDRYDYETRMYKFYISKNDEFDVTFNTSSMRFLSDHGLSLDKWLHDSIPFCTSEEYTIICNKFRSQMSRLNRNSNIEPSRPEDVQFLATALESLREWLDTEEDFEENIFLFPSCNSFRRRLLYEKVPKVMERLDLILEPYPSSPTQIQASISFESSHKMKRAQVITDRWIEKLRYNAGFYAIFKALSDVCQGKLKLYSYPQQNEQWAEEGWGSKNFVTPLEMPSLPQDDEIADEALDIKRQKSQIYPSATQAQRPIPIIVHNGLMDLLFLMSHFHCSKLPSTWSQAKQLIHYYFPYIYDTKYIAVDQCSQFMTLSNGTALEPLYQSLCCVNHPNTAIVTSQHPNESPSTNANTLPKITTIQPMPEEEQNCNHASAACDAYMTGCIFLKLSKLLIQHQSNISFNTFLQNNNDILSKNKLHCTHSFFAISLRSRQDLFSSTIDPNTIYHIADIDTDIRKMDVQIALEKYVKIFSIFMLDNNKSFFVFCKESSNLIFTALRRRFPRQKIMTLKDYMEEKLQLEKEEEEQQDVKRKCIHVNSVDGGEVILQDNFSNIFTNVAVSVRNFLFGRKRKRS